jgi:hypothetical protein
MNDNAQAIGQPLDDDWQFCGFPINSGHYQSRDLLREHFDFVTKSGPDGHL